ncbi:DUF859 domain-containing protein [Breznakia sp. OttesenSCG-928-G09]|nr:DUF859 domain-containing protein [Breznakia sp. OttesenSCG-928-G09]
MATHYLNTNSAYAKIRVDTSASIVGTYPNIKYRIGWNMRYYCPSGYASMVYNGVDFWFHTTHRSANTNFYLTAGQTSPIYASGTIDLAMGNSRSFNAKPGAGVSNGILPGSGTVTTSTVTIPSGTLTASVVSYTHNSVVINSAVGSNAYNYWYAAVYNGSTKLKNLSNGNNTITGLDPGRQYNLTVKLIGRDGSVIKSVALSFRTTGFSYVDGEPTADIGAPLNFNVRTYDDLFRNELEIIYNSETLFSIDDFTSTGLVYPVSVTFTDSQVNKLYESIPNALSLNLIVRIRTYENDTLLGTTDKAIKLTVNRTLNAPVINSFAYQDIVTKALDKTENNQYVIQGVSKLVINNINAQAKNHASIVSYTVNVSNNTYSSNSPSISTNEITENTELILTVMDSRGLQTQLSKYFVKFIPYKRPVIQKFAMERVNGVEDSTKLITSGTFNRLNIDDVDKNTDLILRFRSKKSTDSTWDAWTSQVITINDSTFSYDNVVGIFDVDSAYDFELEISDYFYSVYALANLIKSKPELSIRDGHVGVNTVPDTSKEEILQVDGKIMADGINDHNGDSLIFIPHDYIEESDTEGAWTYIKYASGLCYMWYSAQITTAVNQGHGSMFISPLQNGIDYPFPLTDKMRPNLQINAHPYSATDYLIFAGWNQNVNKILYTRTPNFRLMRGASVTSGIFRISIQIVGFWK